MADRLRSGVEVTTGWIQASRLGFCASAHAENLTITSTVRHFCLLPRKRCCPLSPVKHPKILRPLRGRAARRRLGSTETKLSKMKNKQHRNASRARDLMSEFRTNSKRSPWRMFRRSSRRHDPMLLLNMTLFNFTDGWNGAFSREQYARFSV